MTIYYDNVFQVSKLEISQPPSLCGYDMLMEEISSRWNFDNMWHLQNVEVNWTPVFFHKLAMTNTKCNHVWDNVNIFKVKWFLINCKWHVWKIMFLLLEHLPRFIWVWVNTYRYIFSGMNIHLPAILGFTRYQGFDSSPYLPWWATSLFQPQDDLGTSRYLVKKSPAKHRMLSGLYSKTWRDDAGAQGRNAPFEGDWRPWAQSGQDLTIQTWSNLEKNMSSTNVKNKCVCIYIYSTLKWRSIE